MECRFHVGQQVMCINDKWITKTPDQEIKPKKGMIYTIRSIEWCADRFITAGVTPGVYLRFIEIINPTIQYSNGTQETSFKHTAFRALNANEQKYDISVFTNMLKMRKIEVE